MDGDSVSGDPRDRFGRGRTAGTTCAKRGCHSLSRGQNAFCLEHRINSDSAGEAAVCSLSQSDRVLRSRSREHQAASSHCSMIMGPLTRYRLTAGMAVRVLWDDGQWYSAFV
ncbi:unnamed protein product, partial [Scytosiphon promiscuus]